MTKKLYIKTYGCQMNVYDSERMASLLSTVGYEETASPEDADMVLLNTCHIREKAAEKIYSELGRLKPLKETRPGMQVAVSGCVAQAEGEEIVRRQPIVDVVVGPQMYHRLPQFMDSARSGNAVVATDFPTEDKFDHLPADKATRRAPAAFLTVQEGCDKFCAFCVVPYTRGAEVSRAPEKLIAEAQDLIERGVSEITLLGQNVNAYQVTDGDETWSLARLIRTLAEIRGLERIRYTTSHPNDMSDDLIAAHAEIPKLMPYLHLPVQSGSDRVLKAMNRRHTATAYLKTIDRIRAARPDIALSGDFIVGFPGETEDDFAETLALCDAVGYAQAYSFKYSARPGTPAADRPLVDADVASERLARLQACLARHQTAFQNSMVGKTLPVLFEKVGRKDGQIIGRSPYLQSVVVDGATDMIGRIASIEITAANPNSLSGQFLPVHA